jgi:hypothetical protein
MPTQQKWIVTTLLAFSAANALPGFAQAPNQQNEPPSTGWRRFGEPAQGAVQADQGPPPSAMPPASAITVPAGTWITVRVNHPLSSDHNQQGDPFTATLAQPLVANGRIIARRGQTVGGVVAEVQKAGHVKGTSRLGLQLTEISLADGRQIQINSRVIERRGETSVGRDAAAIGTTTGVGAAIGAAADGGFGAGMGAIGGAVVSTIGVLVTRGRATEVYPETPVTFRLEAPINIPAEYAEAFPPVTQEDYEQRALARPGPSLRQPPPPPYYYGSYYYPPPYYYGYGYGPSLFFYSGPRFYYRGHYRRW